ncbi:MAG: hypothetical protein HY074_03455 [Deltaproteobacteria bacterium]|nr:hypothetical protein [Deltaproteobacteria bacterium]
MANMFALSVVGTDEPGIIAAITQVLLKLDCNLADTSMSVLSGHFSMVLIVQAPLELTQSALERALASISRSFELMIGVQHIAHGELPPLTAVPLKKRELAMVTVYGDDRPGIVHGVAAAIAKTQSNIIDLRTQQLSRETRFYSVFLEVQLGEGATSETLKRELGPVIDSFGLQLQIQPVSETEAL